MSTQQASEAYLKSIKEASDRANEVKAKHPEVEVQDLIHYFLNLNLSPEERLAKSLERSNARRIFSS